MIFNHHRFQIWNQNQHPFVHSMSDFGYANPNLPGITNMQGALDYLVAVIYPNAKAAVATPADLPLTGNTVGDYRVVNDDGDGRSAGYRWEQREGEAEASWHKIYDVDWSTDSILSAWQNQTLGFYVQKIGHDDADETGTPITGLFAGQRVYGGASPNTNLTLSANSGDGAGPQTGFVQVTDHFRPATDNELSLGTTDERWMSVWAHEVNVGTMSLSGGSLTDSSGDISMGTTNLNTQGALGVGTTSISGVGQIFDTTGTIDFDTTDIRTLGDVYANSVVLTSGLDLPSGSRIADFTFTNGNIDCDTTSVNLNDLSFTTTGVLYAGDLYLMNNLYLYDNNIQTTVIDSSLNISANGIGKIIFGSEVLTANQVTVSNAPLIVSGAAGYFEAGSIKIQNNTISSTGTNITISPGNFVLGVGATIVPATDDVRSFGNPFFRWRNLFLTQSINDGTDAIYIVDLMKLKDANYRDSSRSQFAQVGDSLFWDGNQWLASSPDTEIDHSTIGGLTDGDAGHTQFALLQGRSGGQELRGGAFPSESLVLDSTSDSTKGFIEAKSTIRPFTDAAYSAQWFGTDLGASANRWRDIHLAGEIKGARVENVNILPAASSQKLGRLYYLTTDQNIYVDIGTTVKQVGGSRVYYETSWNGTDLVKDVTVAGVDARFAIWQLKDNSNDFENMYVSIKATSATNVRITVGSPLPAGTYRLVGV